MKTYNCPECGANVPLADMNVAADVALCRACGMRSRIAELRESGDDATDYKALSGPTPKHVKVVRDLNDPSVKNGNLSEKACGYWDEDALDYALAMIKRYRA